MELASRPSILLLAAALGGCLGVDPQAESSSEAENVEGMELRVAFEPPMGWPASTDTVSGTSNASRTTLHQIRISPSNEVTMEKLPLLEVAGDAYFLSPGATRRIELSAASTSYTPTQYFTAFAVALQHRPAFSRFTWRNVSGGPVYDPERGHKNTDEIAHFRSPMYIDLENRGLSFLVGETWEWLSFGEIGINEPIPEFLVTVIPTADPGSLTDTYSWTLHASCDGAACAPTDRLEAAWQSWGVAFPGEPWAGIGYSAAGESLCTFLGVPSAIVIGSVQPGSPAAAAGLRKGDVVTRVDGAPIASQYVRSVIQAAGVGAVLEIVLLHEHELTPVTTRLTVGAAPERR